MVFTTIRLVLLEFLGTWLYLTLGGLGTLRQPYLPALTWGAALTVGSLLGSQMSHLNPAVTLAMSTSGQSKLSSLPSRFLGQFSGALVAGITIVGLAPSKTVNSMMVNGNITNMEWSEPWFTMPSDGSTVYSNILAFTMASVMFQLVFCASEGSALYHGISLATIITVLGPSIGAGLNPAREVMGRLVVSYYHWNWDVFMFNDVWAWIPLAWSFPGCLAGAFVYWLAVKLPKHLESKENLKQFNQQTDCETPCNKGLDRVSPVLDEKPITEKPLVITNLKKSPSQQLKDYLDKDVSPSAVKKFCKKNQISIAELEHYLARYKSVPVDQLDLGNGVSVKVGDGKGVVIGASDDVGDGDLAKNN